MELVYVQEGFVWLPTVTRLSESCPTHFELHSAPFGSIAPMTVNGFDHELKGLRLWISVDDLLPSTRFSIV